MSESYTTGGDTLQSVDNPNWQGQTFVIREDHILHFIDLEMRGAMRITLPVIQVFYADINGHPWGNCLSRDRYIVEKKCSFFTTGRVRFSMQPFLLERPSRFVIIVQNYPALLGTSASWQFDKGDATYPRGMRISSDDSGTTWTNHPDDDFMFAEFGDPPLPKPDPPPPIDNFSPLDLAYYHLPTSITFSLATSVPCHLTCYYTDEKPRRHKTSRIERGLEIPWQAYFCFVAWKEVEQVEPGDTLYHTFQIPDWVQCQTRWFTFRGNVDETLSPSVGPIFKHHHPGVAPQSFTLQIAHNNDDYRRLDSIYQACPAVCPPILEAGYFYAHSLHVGCGMRFVNVSIPRYATILEANLTFTCWQTLEGTCRYTRISAEQEDNPPDFSLDDWLSAKERWQNSGTAIDWDDIPYWYLDLEYTSPDISVAIQELVNRPFWLPRNAMVLFFNDWDERAGHLPYKTRRAYSYNVNPAKAVKLYVRWEA